MSESALTSDSATPAADDVAQSDTTTCERVEQFDVSDIMDWAAQVNQQSTQNDHVTDVVAAAALALPESRDPTATLLGDVAGSSNSSARG